MLLWTWVCSYLFKNLSLLLGIYPEEALLDHILILFLNFQGTTTLFSIATVLHFHQQGTKLKFLHILSNPVFGNSHPNGCKVAFFLSLPLLRIVLLFWFPILSMPFFKFPTCRNACPSALDFIFTFLFLITYYKYWNSYIIWLYFLCCYSPFYSSFVVGKFSKLDTDLKFWLLLYEHFILGLSHCGIFLFLLCNCFLHDSSEFLSPLACASYMSK